jgi:hypothetical protein
MTALNTEIRQQGLVRQLPTQFRQLTVTVTVSYLREFMGDLPPAGSRGLADFREQAAESLLKYGG